MLLWIESGIPTKLGGPCSTSKASSYRTDTSCPSMCFGAENTLARMQSLFYGPDSILHLELLTGPHQQGHATTTECPRSTLLLHLETLGAVTLTGVPFKTHKQKHSSLHRDVAFTFRVCRKPTGLRQTRRVLCCL